MLNVSRLTIRTTQDGFTLVDDLSFTLNAGESFAIIGSEGAGKSTLLQAIHRCPTPHVDITGDIRSHGKTAYLEQDVLATWRHETLLDFFVKTTPDEIPPPEAFERLADMKRRLNEVGFPDASYDETRRLESYSGGEIVKLAVAKLLLSDADIFLLDEPTNDLDFETIVFLEDFIVSTDKAVLFISHDEALLEATATGIIHLRRIMKRTRAETAFLKCDYASYVERFESDLARQETLARKERAEHRKKVERFRRIYQKVEHRQNQAVRDPETARLLKKKIKSLKSTEKRYEKEKEGFIPIPEREEPVDLRFDPSLAFPKGKSVFELSLATLERGGKTLSKNIELSVKGPEKIAIIGKNGVGKTTLLHAVHEHLKTRPGIRAGLMMQHYEDLAPHASALTFLIGADADRQEEARVRKMMGALAFERNEMEQSPHDLSGGQKAKLCLLKMVLESNNVLLLDEPTRNLSPLSAPQIHRLLERFGGAIVCVTHDRRFIDNVFDTLYELTPAGLHKRA